MMSGEDDPRRGKPVATLRPGHVSLFRPGQRLPGDTVTLDQRTGREVFMTPVSFAPLNSAKVWESITELTPDIDRLAGNGLFLDAEQHAVARTFDMLRTRLLQGMAKHGWTRLAVTSPTHGCGKSFVAANLSLSLARLPSCRTVLLDLELRAPHLAGLFGQQDAAPISDFLSGDQPLEATFRRIGRNLALGLNGEPVALAAETLQDPEFAKALEALRDLLQPDLVVIDTPPALASDDVIALAGQIDAVLLVTDGTRTSPAEITECERLFDGRIPLLGVVLNRAQDMTPGRHRNRRR
ncbi:MAG: CpsD/CapB family tyrosine-protein kinase [Rhodobacteraceae bacterium]|jgi:protein-tyrosine kinase|nr:CpsD/CapB family tyrosine-protein kinase [Paracoccaceae bacterium]